MIQDDYSLPVPFGDYSGAAPDPDAVESFRGLIYEYYGAHGRSFPWRETADPYGIIVSEIMLQQTQTHRVLPKYEAFIGRWPTFEALASASLKEVFGVWRGLGYNRRARALTEIARIVTEEYGGGLPETEEELEKLPMIGRTTARAVLAFAFDHPVVFIETNIRRVFIYFFFERTDEVRDSMILPVAERTADAEDPRSWHYALMDYGVMLKSRIPNPNARSAHFTRQSPFENSNRQIRGSILRVLNERSRLGEHELYCSLEFERERIRSCLDSLVSEGMVAERRSEYFIPD